VNDGRRERADRLRAVPLETVLRSLGAEPDRRDKHKWHTSQGVLSVCGPKFMNWHRGIGGGGAIDLVIHLENLRFPAALDWLERRFTDVVITASIPPPPLAALRLPPPDPAKLGRVAQYLVRQRGIAPTCIDSLIQTGALYADARANAVFLLLGDENIPVGAELRGTLQDRSWRGLAPGSRKDLGFFSVPAAPLPAIILCESAIDAISCSILHPQHRGISTAGARPNPPWLARLTAHASQVYCGFDADLTGDHMAAQMIAAHPTVRRLRPSLHDWNDVLRSRS
jgi:hypothetical protein